MPARGSEAKSLVLTATGAVVEVVSIDDRVPPVTGSVAPGAPIVPAAAAGRTAMPTIGRLKAPDGWPRSAASPKVASAPSAPTAQ